MVTPGMVDKNAFENEIRTLLEGVNRIAITFSVVAILAVFAGTIFNNSRITDLRKDIGRHIDDKFALLSQQIKTMEKNLMRIFGDHDTRIQKVEQPG